VQVGDRSPAKIASKPWRMAKITCSGSPAKRALPLLPFSLPPLRSRQLKRRLLFPPRTTLRLFSIRTQMDLAKRGTNKQTSRGNRKPRELSDLHRDMNFMHRSQAILDGVFTEMTKKVERVDFHVV
jgi:hypothetical protein